MGTASSKKILKNTAGFHTEEAALLTSAGAGDADRLPALNAAGVLDDSILNASATSAANKLVKMTAAGIIAPSIINATVTSAGAADTGKVMQLDSSGKMDSTMLPVGVGADTATITTSEALAAGDYVNVWNVAGAKVRKADATVSGKHAHGFVLSAFGAAAAAIVYFEGTNTAVSGQTPGDVFLSTTAGTGTATAPTGTGNAVQALGIAISPTAVNFQYTRPIILA